MTIVVIYKQPPEGEKLNVKRYVDVVAIEQARDSRQFIFMGNKTPIEEYDVMIDLTKVAEIKIIPLN